MIEINCDLCGKADESLYKALIEDVELNACSKCSKFGKVLGQIKKPITSKIKQPKKQITTLPEEEKIELLVENYSEIIKKRREALHLTQKEFAKKINEKESIIHKIEIGSLVPPLELARKLEKFLGIKLIEKYEERHESAKKQRPEGFTLGDFIKLK